MVKIGNAPVSYGAFEVTVGKHDGVPTAPEVLDAVQAAGYEGIDLGPLGYLGLGAELKQALTSRGLLLTGGYVEIDVSADEAPAAGLAELAQVCGQFDAVADGIGPEFLPRPTVALIGSAVGALGPGQRHLGAGVDTGVALPGHRPPGGRRRRPARDPGPLAEPGQPRAPEGCHAVAVRAAVHRRHGAVGRRRARGW